jgi:hypothetical protein
MVPEAGLEPACPIEREILSLLCIPFHHSGVFLPYQSTYNGSETVHLVCYFHSRAGSIPKALQLASMYFDMVRKERLELSILSAVASKTTVYTIPPLAQNTYFNFLKNVTNCLVITIITSLDSVVNYFLKIFLSVVAAFCLVYNYYIA